MLKHEKLDAYLESYHKLMEMLIAYHNKHCLHLKRPTERTTATLKSMLREIRKYTKEMAPLINETHVEEMENRKIKPRLDKYYEKEKLNLREPKSISK